MAIASLWLYSSILKTPCEQSREGKMARKIARFHIQAMRSWFRYSSFKMSKKDEEREKRERAFLRMEANYWRS